jgi:signal transduction histidine kinase
MKLVTRGTFWGVLAGFALAIGAILFTAGASLLAHDEFTRASASRHTAQVELLEIEKLRSSFAMESSAQRGLLLSGQREFSERAAADRAQVLSLLEALEKTAEGDLERTLVSEIRKAEADYQTAVQQAIALDWAGSRGVATDWFLQHVVPRKDATQWYIEDLAAERGRALQTVEVRVHRAQQETVLGVVLASALALLGAVSLAVWVLRAHRREAKAVETWTHFLAIASHDLKTPVSTLVLRSEILERRMRAAGGVDPRWLDDLRRMRGECDRLASLIGSVLDLSRLRLGELSLTPREVDLSSLTAEVAERMRQQFEATQVSLMVHAPGPVVGRWDPLRMEQVLTNLLTNALKYGERRPVDVVVEETNGWALVAVADHGKGIRPEDRPRLFQPFVRSKGERAPGHGLGLFITQSIVQAHRGRIRLESTPGGGATFVVELPRTPEARVAGQSTA